MGLRFCFGASGAGKSKGLQEEMIERSIREPEKEFLFLVPDQFTMQTQKDLVLAHPNKGIMNVDVLSFGRLAHRIAEELGGSQPLVLDDTGKSLILRKIAQGIKEQLPVIGANLGKMGYIHEVKSAISELMQYGIGEKEMEELVAFSGKRGALHHKLKDLGILYTHFLSYMNKKFITTEETLDVLRKRLSDSALIKRSVIVLDGFTGFTPVQEQLIVEMAALAHQVTISIVMGGSEDPYLQDGEHKLFSLSKKTVYRLEKLIGEAGISREEDWKLKPWPLPRFRENEQLQHLESQLFRYPSLPCQKECDLVSLWETTDPAAEARQVCMKIRELVRTKGYCYRDFAVITGDLASYAAHFEAEAVKYDLPLYIDRTRGILLNPFIEWIRSALLILKENFSYRSIFHYLRSGLSGIERDRIDRLENYVLALGIKGKKKWTGLFTAQLAGSAPEELVMLNELREGLLLQLAPLMERAKTGGERVRQLYRFIVENKIQEKLSLMEQKFLAEGDRVRAKEYSQIYRLVMDLLDQVDALLGEEPLTAAEFGEILDAGFGEIQVGTIPQDVDRIVVGDMERTRLKEVKLLFFVGINDGNIPKNTGGGGILSDIDREFLKDSPYTLKPTPREQLYIQRLYLYMNLTKPSDRLFLSYCKVNGEGKSLRPAYLIDTLKKLFPRLQTEYPQLRPWEERIETKKDGLDDFSKLLRRYASGLMEEEEKEDFYGLYRIYQRAERYGKLTGKLVEAAFYSYQKQPLPGELVHKLYSSCLIGSVSRLEQYAACAYAHFLKYGLALKERQEYGFEAVDLGNVFHGVLERFSKELIKKGQTWFTFSKEEAGQLLEQSLSAVAAGYGQTVLYSTARNEYALKRMKRILHRTVMTLQSQLRKGAFSPKHFELSFAEAEETEAVSLKLSERERMRLTGRIDRIDTYEDEDKIYVKVIDFKSGTKKFDLAAFYYGLQLQLVVYMNTAVQIEKRSHPDKEVKPAALLYYHITDPLIKIQENTEAEEVEAMLQKELRMNGLVGENEEIVSLLDREFQDKSDVIPVERKKDGSFSARSGVVSGEDMELLSSFVNQKICQIGREITKGNIELNPCEQGGSTACDYCNYKTVCGFDTKLEGCRRRRLKELKPEEVLTIIRQEMNQPEERGD